jgi:hypothetical protein
MHSVAGILFFEIFRATFDSLYKVFEGTRIGVAVNRGREPASETFMPRFPAHLDGFGVAEVNVLILTAQHTSIREYA